LSDKLKSLKNIDLSHLTTAEAKEFTILLEELEKREHQIKSTSSFLDFVTAIWSEFISGDHHAKMAKAFDDIASGKLKRLIINMPPRHTKSEFASHLFPAYLLGKNPKLKIIEATHTADLAINFGRKVRDLIDSEEYNQLFPETELKADSRSAGKWLTNKGGEYYAAGTGGALAGRGADLFIIDDPHSEQDAMSDKALDEAYEWFMTGPRQRLQPGGAIVIVMTRWSKKDLTGRLIKKMAQEKGADQWEVIEFPAILPSGNPLWANFWSKDELESIKASVSPSKWAAQYMQRPTGEGISIIPKDWFMVWDQEKPPTCDYLIQSYDTAFLKSERADFTAITTWGVFYPEGKIGDEMYTGDEAHLILIDCIKERFDFPELKQEALRLYEYWEPDNVIIEAKGSGLPLIQELRRIGIPVNTFSPGKGQDKIARLNSVSPIFQDGRVWVPDNRFGEELMEEVSDFPGGENDDLVDATTLALARFREGGFLQLSTDMDDEPSYYPTQRVYY
jgi:predicted phage terminase large subunit-like protein|tara:strand:+ start:1558 stop:3075 length:1518 start_codon:yes stop_codon:yes gene_type:complete